MNVLLLNWLNYCLLRNVFFVLWLWNLHKRSVVLLNFSTRWVDGVRLLDDSFRRRRYGTVWGWTVVSVISLNWYVWWKNYFFGVDGWWWTYNPLLVGRRKWPLNSMYFLIRFYSWSFLIVLRHVPAFFIGWLYISFGGLHMLSLLDVMIVLWHLQKMCRLRLLFADMLKCMYFLMCFWVILIFFRRVIGWHVREWLILGVWIVLFLLVVTIKNYGVFLILRTIDLPLLIVQRLSGLYF